MYKTDTHGRKRSSITLIDVLFEKIKRLRFSPKRSRFYAKSKKIQKSLPLYSKVYLSLPFYAQLSCEHNDSTSRLNFYAPLFRKAFLRPFHTLTRVLQMYASERENLCGVYVISFAYFQNFADTSVS